MTELMFGRAPLFDDRARPAAYRIVAKTPELERLLESVLARDIQTIGRGLPVLCVVRTVDLPAVLAHPQVDQLWAEPAESQLGAESIAAWRAAAATVGIVVRDPFNAPGHEALLDVAVAGRIHADGLTLDELRDRRLALRGLPTMATGVHTTELHRHVRAVGIELVGGRYLDDVELTVERTVEGDRMTLLELSALLQSSDPALNDVTNLIERSPTLSFEVLRWINSAFVGLKHRVDDLRRAVGLLGPGRITQVVSLLLARDLSDRPTELFRQALVRARMCEAIAGETGGARQAHYITGLFSMLEALLEIPLPQLLAELPLTEEVSLALLHHEGPMGRVLQACKLYEHSEFDAPELASFDPLVLSTAYFDGLAYADSVLTSAASEPVAV